MVNEQDLFLPEMSTEDWMEVLSSGQGEDIMDLIEEVIDQVHGIQLEVIYFSI
jgi:hypothetical protein